MFPQQNWIIDFFLMFPFHAPAASKEIIKDKGIAAKLFNKHFLNGTTYSTMDQAKFMEDSP